MMINIESMNRALLKQLNAFNSHIYPEKRIPTEQYINFFLSKSEKEISSCIIMKDEADNIVGQILASSMAYFLNGKRTDSVWLYDLIVDESLRKSAWGIDLLLYCMEQHPNSCSTGSGPTALPLHLKLGNKMLGEIRKYVGIVNPLFFITSYHRKAVEIYKFPNKIIAYESRYVKVNDDQLPSYQTPFNMDLFEIARDRDFLKWRFFNDLHQYAFYLADDGLSYFVVRSILLKGFRVLELVDYRCKATENDFEQILFACHQCAKAIHLPAVVCGSSLEAFDKVLERHHYRSMGRPRPVIGFVKCKDRKEDIEKRNYCFVTLADSDGETNWL